LMLGAKVDTQKVTLTRGIKTLSHER